MDSAPFDAEFDIDAFNSLGACSSPEPGGGDDQVVADQAAAKHLRLLLAERKGGSSSEDDLIRIAANELAHVGVDRRELARMLETFDYERLNFGGSPPAGVDAAKVNLEAAEFALQIQIEEIKEELQSGAASEMRRMDLEGLLSSLRSSRNQLRLDEHDVGPAEEDVGAVGQGQPLRDQRDSTSAEPARTRRKEKAA